MRNYTMLDLIRYAKLAKENSNLKPLELIKIYKNTYPELTEEQKIKNLAKALKMNFNI